MKDIPLKKRVVKSLIFWIAMSAAWVASIPLMVVALVNGNWFVAIPCIVVCSVNFFSVPLGWTHFGSLVASRNICMTIVDDGITDLRMLATTLGKKPKEMLGDVRGLISNRYLRGYALNEDCTQLIRVEKPEPIVDKKTQRRQTHCHGCGAVITSDAENCIYCNSRLQ